MSNILPATSEDIKRAADIIREGGLVAFPTETVYGLGADALNPHAVARVFEVKNRPHFDPMIVHINSLACIEQLCLKVDERARRLMERFWPGPLTLVLPKSQVVPDIVTAGLPTVAVRMPSHPVALELIKEAGTPIAAPSANLFGHLSPTSAEHVREQVGSKVDLILDGGKCPVGVESTVISLTEKEALLLRPGGLSLEDTERVIGKVKIPKSNPKRPQSPGQLLRHYSPKTPLRLLTEEIVFENGKRIGFLAFTPPEETLSYEMVEVLSPRGDLREAAANLFSCLHRLDKAGLDIIYAEPVSEGGLGRAIMDRLCRASREYCQRGE
ncbi:MAG: threonylcarbamoyl-AMP synthase [Candidatus Altiarchaeales archaeon]|nr:threonylcarbamoyl-AMP synthase [Candidatus Altiarchaeota archaeon]MBU4341888.1 threonylcarbamoyl-AMP synthase [Candidatus Altiarchaeota archaeon]MCG2782933.1 threonylcarbamoyl-AMP synthase [Candidatus Altiarchaeales archaeon]